MTVFIWLPLLPRAMDAVLRTVLEFHLYNNTILSRDEGVIMTGSV